MKLSKDSWHVKLNKEYGIDRVKWNIHYGTPTSLCDYFWSTVMVICLLTLLCTAFTLGVGAVLYGILCLSGLLFSPATGIWFDFIVYDMGIGLLIISFVYGVVQFIIGLFNKEVRWFPKYITKYFKTPENTKVLNENKKPNLFIEWVKAKKAKVCPLVEIE